MTSHDSATQQVRRRYREVLERSSTSINRLAGGNAALQRKIQRQINEDAAITLDTILCLLEAFPDLSAQWLLTGCGPMSASGEDAPGIDCGDVVASASDVQLVGTRPGERLEEMLAVPIYSVEASANLNTLQTGDDLNNVEGMLYVPGIPRIDGATHVRGDSMYPTLHSGDLIGFRILPVSYDSIFYGEIYLLSLDVDGDSYVTVKRIQPGERGPEYIRLESSNPAHPSKEIHLSSVRSLAMVKVTIHSL